MSRRREQTSRDVSQKIRRKKTLTDRRGEKWRAVCVNREKTLAEGNSDIYTKTKWVFLRGKKKKKKKLAIVKLKEKRIITLAAELSMLLLTEWAATKKTSSAKCILRFIFSFNLVEEFLFLSKDLLINWNFPCFLSNWPFTNQIYFHNTLFDSSSIAV